jgi:hypothetical protein
VDPLRAHLIGFQNAQFHGSTFNSRANTTDTGSALLNYHRQTAQRCP